MDEETQIFYQMFKRFFDANTRWSEIFEIYPKIMQFIKANHMNNTQIINLIDKKYQITLQEQSFQNIVQYLLIIWVVIFAVGNISNGIVILVLTRVDNKSVYDIICVGLAVTDLLILIVVVPITTMWYWFQDFRFYDFLCPFVNFIVYVALFSSASMLLTLTVTRFLAVVHPWKNRMISAKGAKIACCIAWIVGGMCSIPVAVYFGVENKTKNRTQITYIADTKGVKKCRDLFPNQTARTVYFVLVFLLTYLLPFMSIIIMNYMIVSKLKHEVNQISENPALILKAQTGLSSSVSSREARKRQVRNRVTKMVILVTTLYCVCWLPTQLVNIWYYSDPDRFPKNLRMQYIKFISQTLSFASTCINPIVYSVVNVTFKMAAKKQFPCLFRSTDHSKTLSTEVDKTSIVQKSQLTVSKDKIQKSISDNLLKKTNETSKSSKKTKANVIENKSVINACKIIEPENSKPNKKNLLNINSDSKKNKKPSYSPHIESQASCSVFSFEGFTDNLDSTIENTSYNLITKV